MNEIYEEKDKVLAPFLLAASFQGLIKFQGSKHDLGILHWKFSPSEKVKRLLQQFSTKTEPHIPAVDLFTATETWWKEIAEMRKGEIIHGKFR